MSPNVSRLLPSQRLQLTKFTPQLNSAEQAGRPHLQPERQVPGEALGERLRAAGGGGRPVTRGRARRPPVLVLKQPGRAVGVHHREGRGL